MSFKNLSLKIRFANLKRYSSLPRLNPVASGGLLTTPGSSQIVWAQWLLNRVTQVGSQELKWDSVCSRTPEAQSQAMGQTTEAPCCLQHQAANMKKTRARLLDPRGVHREAMNVASEGPTSQLWLHLPGWTARPASFSCILHSTAESKEGPVLSLPGLISLPPCQFQSLQSDYEVRGGASGVHPYLRGKAKLWI